MKKTVSIIIIVIILLQCFCNFVFAQSDVNVEDNNATEEETTDEEYEEQLQQQRDELNEMLEEKTVELEYVQDELSDVMIQIQELEDQISEYEKEMEQQQSQIETLQISINDCIARLEIASMDYEEKKEILINRLVAMYEAGDTEYLDVLLKSKSVVDFISRYYLIEQMAEYDTELIESIQKEKENIATTTAQLEKEQEEIIKIKAENEKMAVILSNTKTLQEAYSSKLTDEEKALQEEITAYKEELEEIERQILLSTLADVNIQYTGGEMLWPVAASGTVITSTYGIRVHPIQGIVKQHTGLDIAGAAAGTPVVAAADGVVTYAGWLGGYGNCVMINHGDGVVTLYGHGSEILTEVGAEVKQGDTIMAVGSTGNSTGPHLHFEVRVNGEYTNPLYYVNIP